MKEHDHFRNLGDNDMSLIEAGQRHFDPPPCGH
jgi:hypothetical protein